MYFNLTGKKMPAGLGPRDWLEQHLQLSDSTDTEAKGTKPSEFVDYMKKPGPQQF